MGPPEKFKGLHFPLHDLSNRWDPEQDKILHPTKLLALIMKHTHVMHDPCCKTGIYNGKLDIFPIFALKHRWQISVSTDFASARRFLRVFEIYVFSKSKTN